MTEFDATGIYLNTATYGLPPRRAVEALTTALADWQAGRCESPMFDACVDDARALYAGLIGIDASWVAIGSQASVFSGLIAANLPVGSRVLVAAEDFTSVTFPFFAQAPRGITVTEAPLAGLIDAITPATSLVAVSAVQSADGRVLDLDALASASRLHGVPVMLDVTQAAGWLPIGAARFAYVICAAYKWLLCPRGVAFMAVHPSARDGLIPHHANWYAGEFPWTSIYGGPLRLAPDARRFDLSPAWHAFVGAVPALELLSAVGVPALHAHAVGLANRFRAGIGLADSDSAIVSLAVAPSAAAALAGAGISAAERAGRLRLSFHISNDDADADHAARVLEPHLR